jgi:hypothetical protein
VMSPRPALAALIRIALFVCVPLLVPTLAHAHAGHAHHATGVTPPPQASTAAEPAAIDHAKTSRQEQIISSTTARHAAPAPSGTCSVGCCGAGVGCCGAALMVGSAGDLPDPGRDHVRLRIVPDRRSGIDPDAPARPPRHSA